MSDSQSGGGKVWKRAGGGKVWKRVSDNQYYTWVPPGEDATDGKFVFADRVQTTKPPMHTGNFVGADGTRYYSLELVPEDDIKKDIKPATLEQFYDSIGRGRTTLDISDEIPIGTEFGWNHGLGAWVYKVNAMQVFRIKWNRKAVMARMRDMLTPLIKEQYDGALQWHPIMIDALPTITQYRWISPSKIDHGMFMFKDTHGQEYPVKVGHGDIMTETESIERQAFLNSTGDGKTTLILPGLCYDWKKDKCVARNDIPKGSQFGWNYDLEAWVYRVKARHFYKKWNKLDIIQRLHGLVSQNGGANEPYDVAELGIKDLPEITHYRWVSPSTSDHGMFIFHGHGKSYEVMLKTYDIMDKTNSASRAQFDQSTQDGRTTIELQGIPMFSRFGWNYDLNSWVYEIKEVDGGITYLSKPLYLDSLVGRLVQLVKPQQGGAPSLWHGDYINIEGLPIDYYKWVPPSGTNHGMFEFYDLPSHTSMLGKYKIEIQPGDIAKNTMTSNVSEFEDSHGNSTTTLKLAGIPKGTEFGWNYDLEAWVYRVSPEQYVSKSWNKETIAKRLIKLHKKP